MTSKPKYARLEHERRFLVLDPPDLADLPYRLIEDRYIDASRLRLRRITHSGSGHREFKLCKKYPDGDPVSGAITNIYLSESEYEVLAALPGRPIRKRRYVLSWGGRGFGLDVFEGALAGLVLCEAEAETREAVMALSFPPWAEREVTGDAHYTGGNLSRAGRPSL